jgi:hypothetical protein
MNIDALVSKVLDLRTRVAELEEQAEELKLQRAEAEAQLMELMASSGQVQAGTTRGTATLQRKVKLVITGWDDLLKYIVRTESFDMLQQRISPNAVKARLENEEEVPGITGIEVYAVSIRKK